MQDLIGRDLVIEGISYHIVDVRRVEHEMMVYAEPSDAPAAGNQHPFKAAFRLDDVFRNLSTAGADA